MGRAAPRGECRDVYRETSIARARAEPRHLRFRHRREDEDHHQALDEVNVYINPTSLTNLLKLPLAVRRLISPDSANSMRST